MWRNSLQTNYDLRDSHTDLVLPKPRREFPREAKEAQSIYSFKYIVKQFYCYR